MAAPTALPPPPVAAAKPPATVTKVSDSVAFTVMSRPAEMLVELAIWASSVLAMELTVSDPPNPKVPALAPTPTATDTNVESELAAR